MSREILMSYLNPNEPVLEIGPLDNPFVTKQTHDVYYADVRSNNDIYGSLKRSLDVKAAGTAVNAKDRLTAIDYMVGGTYLEAVGDKRFSAVFSSHVIEHVPDIIRFLLELSDILTEDGKIVMAIPDKRGTFDHFREVTPFRDAYDVYINGRNALARLAFDNTNCHPYNEPVAYAMNAVSFQSVAMTPPSDFGSYVDNGFLHYWVFTYESFLALIRDGIRQRLLPFTVEYSAPCKPYPSEFYIVLQKNLPILTDEKLRVSEIVKITEIIETYDASVVPPKINPAVVDAINHKKSVYIYGAGQYGRVAFTYLLSIGISVSGFVISDGEEKETQVGAALGVPVRFLSEIENDGCAFIVALPPHYWEGIVPALERGGFEHYFFPGSFLA